MYVHLIIYRYIQYTTFKKFEDEIFLRNILTQAAYFYSKCSKNSNIMTLFQFIGLFVTFLTYLKYYNPFLILSLSM